jgi:HEPN domain-containing protein
MKKYTEDWLLYADKDLYVAENALDDEYPATNVIAFLSQQSIEKYLKAFLVENDVPIIKTHNFIILNDKAKSIKNMGLDEIKLAYINDVFIEARYPGEAGLLPSGMPTEVQAREFVEYAKEVKSIILKEITSG